MIITTAHMKGGVGKTFILKIMATYFSQKEKVLVIETDSTQASFKDRRETDYELVGKDYDFPFEITSISPTLAAQFLGEARENGTQYDKIFVDTPGSINVDGLMEILSYSDFIILPTRASDDDFIPTKKFINFVYGTVYANLNHEPNLIGIFNQTAQNSLVLKSRIQEVNSEPLRDFIQFVNQVIPSAEAKSAGNILAEDESVKFAGINTFMFPEYISGKNKINIFKNVCTELEEIFNSKK